jgi:ubiquinone/menaquinone biosynthesis C-methylase UbiE
MIGPAAEAGWAQNGLAGRNADSPHAGQRGNLSHKIEGIEQMEQLTNSELIALKARQKATWMAGDFGEVARLTENTATEFMARRRPLPGMDMLDVACGTGNLAIQAARAGATVTGIDIAPNLLDQARTRAREHGLTIRLDQGDAENLPYDDRSFDLVVTMFGAMFAPRPDLVASELIRVCRPGGRIAMANWTPAGFIGQLLRVTGNHVPPPSGIPSPLSWGDQATVRSRFSTRIADLRMTPIIAQLEFPLSVTETVEFYRKYYGPTQRSFEALAEEKQLELRRDMESLYAKHNRASNGTTCIAAEYLEVEGTRA